MPRDYLIQVDGCDDTTLIPMRLFPAELELVEAIARKSKDRGGCCKPTLTIKPMSQASHYELEELAEHDEGEPNV